MIRLVCPKCEKKLGVDDSKAGYAVVCPRCGQKFRIPGVKRAGQPSAARPLAGSARPPLGDLDLVETTFSVPLSPSDNNSSPATNGDDEAPLVLYPEPDPAPEGRTRPKQPRRRENDAAKMDAGQVWEAVTRPDYASLKREAEEPVLEVWEEVEAVEAEPAEVVEDAASPGGPKAKKKKKPRRSRERSLPRTPTWVWWIVFFVSYFLLAVGAAVVGVYKGHGDQVTYYLGGTILKLPVSAVIFFVAMFIGSAMGGGINFGEIHIAIFKTFALLLVVTPISLIPFIGPFLAYPFWLFGLMALFSLDTWETFFLSFINWVLNWLVGWVITTSIIAALQAPARLDKEGPSSPEAPPTHLERGFDVEEIELDLGEGQ
jgi:hypothetical protein